MAPNQQVPTLLGVKDGEPSSPERSAPREDASRSISTESSDATTGSKPSPPSPLPPPPPPLNSTPAPQRNLEVNARDHLAPPVLKLQYQTPSSTTRRRRPPRIPSAGRSDARSVSASQSVALSAFESLNADLERRFRRHGRYVSKHQIRVLLLCSLVITSLFYPAVGIYFWSSKGGPGVTRGSAVSVWRSLSTPFMDSFISSGRKHHNSIRDLRMIWDDAHDLRALDAKDARALFGSSPQVPDTSVPHPLFPYGGVPRVDDPHKSHDAVTDDHSSSVATSRPKRPACRTVRVEHVFVTTDDVLTGQAHRFGVLEPRILSSALRLQSSIEHIIHRRDPAERQAFASGPYQIPQCARVHRLEDRFADLASSQTTETIGPRPSDHVSHSDIISGDSSPCLTLSPNDFWSSAMATLMADTTPTQTILRSARNTSDRTIPLRISTTLAGRWHLFRKLPRAEHLAMTFFLEDEHAGDDCLQHYDSNEGKARDGTGGHVDKMSKSHRAWMRMLSNVTAGQVTIIPSEHEEAKELLLQFTPENPRAGIPASKLLLFAGYFALAAYLGHGLLKLRNVHSRFGMMFTCLTELAISLITSVSICALMVIGSENMFNLIDAIVDSPVDLPVATRVGLGLSQAGIPILITVLSDVLLLSVMAFFITVRAVHEFCIFAICSLIIDFFMQMTLFVTVISIDLQRLELADVLGQSGHGPVPSQHRMSESQSTFDRSALIQTASRRSSTTSRRSTSLLHKGGRALWRARTARTASLTLLMGLMFGIYLYYGTGYPQAPDFPYPRHAAASLLNPSSTPVSSNSPPHAFDPLSHLSPSPEEAKDLMKRLTMPWWMSSPSGPFWHALNPEGAPKVQVFVEPWTIISLRSAHPHFDAPLNKSFAVWALFRPRIRAVIWFLKLVILPITGTTTLLFFLLLYLLKDTDLLDAQRGKGEAETDTDLSDLEDSDSRNHGPSLDLTFYPANAGLVSDIVLTATSQAWVASIDEMGTLSYFRHSRTRTSSPTTIKLSTYAGSQSSHPTALAITSAGGLACVGLSDGRICVVVMSSGKVMSEPPSTTANSKIPALPVQNITIHDGAGEQAQVVIVSQHRDGSAWRWSTDRTAPKCIVPARNTHRWQAFDVAMCSPALDNAGHTVPRLFGFASSNSMLELRTCSIEQTESVKTFSAAETRGRLMRCAALAPLPYAKGRGSGGEVLSLVSGSSDGFVDLWDHNTSAHLGSIELSSGPIVSLRVIEERDRGSALVCAVMGNSVAILRLSYDGPVPEGSVAASISPSSVGGFPPTPGGTLRGPPGIKFATPTWAMAGAGAGIMSANGAVGGLPPPFETYRLSGHNGSLKYRRSSSYGGHARNGSFFGSEVSTSSPPSGSALGIHDSIDPLASPNEGPVVLPPLSPSAPALHPIIIQDLGRIPAERGLVEVVRQSVLLGIRRRNDLSPSEPHSARWEAWMLDTSREMSLQDGLLDVVTTAIDLDACGLAASPVRLGNGNAVSDATGLPSAFQSRRATPQITIGPSSHSRGMLSFTRLHSVNELVTSTPTIAVAFGNVVATLSARIIENLPPSKVSSSKKRR
ncbi:hypothetical protein OC845_000485 [Tilletia horrida]|nr:hypothetical protein OC845_000485 [Tilletia horrida]